MSPWSSSARALSTCREKKGTDPKTRGTMAPRTYSVVPIRVRDRGITQVSRMMKGMDRNRLTALSTIWYSGRFSRMFPGFVTVSSTPRSIPSRKETAPDHNTISSVSARASHKSGSRSIT